MDLYIRALTFYPNVVAVYGCLLLLDMITILVNRLAQLTSTRFISKVLPTYGYRFEKPFSFVKDDSHFVERRPSILPTLMTGIVVFASAISIGYAALACNDDMYPYMFWGALQLLMSIALWYKHVQKYLAIHKHCEQLVVVENCQCLSNPFETVLLLEGYHGEYYTYVVPNTEHWKENMYHKAKCLGAYILELDTENIEPESAIWIGVGDKVTCATWNGIALPITLLLISALSVAAYIFARFLSFLIFGVAILFFAVFYMPWRRTRSLKLVTACRTEVYDDINVVGAFTYVLIDKNGRPYYYQCDDEQAFKVNGSYICETRGNNVTCVLEHTDKETDAAYHPAENVGGMWCIIIVILCGTATSEYLQFIPAVIVGSLILALWFVMLIRYKTKGDI